MKEFASNKANEKEIFMEMIMETKDKKGGKV